MSRARASRVQGGQTPLWYAACHGHLDVVRALLNAGADKTIANNDGKKPIDVVCKHCDKTIYCAAKIGYSPVDNVGKGGAYCNMQHKAAIVALLR